MTAEERALQALDVEAVKEGVDKGLNQSVRGSSVLEDTISNAGQSIEVATENDDLDASIGKLTTQLKRARITAAVIWGIAIICLLARLMV